MHVTSAWLAGIGEYMNEALGHDNRALLDDRTPCHLCLLATSASKQDHQPLI